MYSTEFEFNKEVSLDDHDSSISFLVRVKIEFSSYDNDGYAITDIETYVYKHMSHGIELYSSLVQNSFDSSEYIKILVPELYEEIESESNHRSEEWMQEIYSEMRIA